MFVRGRQGRTATARLHIMMPDADLLPSMRRVGAQMAATRHVSTTRQSSRLAQPAHRRFQPA